MKKYIPFVIAVASFMETLDVTIVTTAIPTMAVHLGTDPFSLKIALTSYLLSIAIFVPISGWLADRFGTKNIFMAAIIFFTIGSLFCGLSVNLNTLVLSRILQGIGGAFMMPVGRLILLQSFPKNELIKVNNCLQMPAQIGPALGPVLGGLIVAYMGWRWIFIVNIPFGIAGIIFAFKVLTHYKNTGVNKLDFIGFILFGLGLAGLAFSFDALGENTFNNAFIIRIILASVIILSIYFIRSRKIKFPFIDLTIFKIRTFKITLIGNFCIRCSLGGTLFLLPLFFQLSLAKSAMYSGFLLLPYAMGLLVMKFFIQKISRLFGFKHLVVANTLLLGVSITAFSLVTMQTPLLLLIAFLFVHGLLASTQFSCMNVLNYVDLTTDNVSKGTSIAYSAQKLSASFGIAFAAIIFRYFLNTQSDLFHIQPYVFHKTFLIVGLSTLLSTYIFTFLRKEDGAEVSKHQQKTSISKPTTIPADT